MVAWARGARARMGGGVVRGPEQGHTRWRRRGVGERPDRPRRRKECSEKRQKKDSKQTQTSSSKRMLIPSSWNLTFGMPGQDKHQHVSSRCPPKLGRARRFRVLRREARFGAAATPVKSVSANSQTSDHWLDGCSGGSGGSTTLEERTVLSGMAVVAAAAASGWGVRAVPHAPCTVIATASSRQKSGVTSRN